MEHDIMKTELMEAVTAGERALCSLYAAKEKLNSARNWGFLDLFGGGFITDMVKHSKLGDASACIEAARSDLQVFQKELKDVDVPMNIRMEIGGFLSFADFFFDGLIADYLVQSKIADARNQVDDAIQRVERLLRELKGRL